MPCQSEARVGNPFCFPEAMPCPSVCKWSAMQRETASPSDLVVMFYCESCQNQHHTHWCTEQDRSSSPEFQKIYQISGKLKGASCRAGHPRKKTRFCSNDFQIFLFFFQLLLYQTSWVDFTKIPDAILPNFLSAFIWKMCILNKNYGRFCKISWLHFTKFPASILPKFLWLYQNSCGFTRFPAALPDFLGLVQKSGKFGKKIRGRPVLVS